MVKTIGLSNTGVGHFLKSENFVYLDGEPEGIIKHGCRTLLKKGNSEVLSILGFLDGGCVRVNAFSLETVSVPARGILSFSFELEAEKKTKARLEYGIAYVKANGRRNRKIFQISELVFKENEKRYYTKTHSFADTSTRKHYPGIHSVTLIVNGTERGTLEFEVLTAI